MRFLVLLSIVGAAVGQVYPQDTPEVAAARDAFMREYNRLALLAADAPDTDVVNEEPRRHLRSHNSHHSQGAPRFQQEASPPYTPFFDAFSYSVNLGGNQQFQPSSVTFRSATNFRSKPSFRTPDRFSTAPTFRTTDSFNTSPTLRTTDVFSTAPTFRTTDTFPTAPILPVTARPRSTRRRKVKQRVPVLTSPEQHFQPSPESIPAPRSGPLADAAPAGGGRYVSVIKDEAAARDAHLSALFAALGFQGA
ncbi:uncharacterized protein [Cherax quadricarinatus]|uniref:uncharacterized protein n=1 Tax=Cherax quadricarinatus TaxID=27406 RepID=UPI00387E9E66